MRLTVCAVLLGFAFVPPAAAQKPQQPTGGSPGKIPYPGPVSTSKPSPLGFTERQPDAAPDGNGRAPLSNERPASSGTGFIVAPGRAMTNNHVVADCSRMVARNAAGNRVPARVMTTDRRRDLAILAVPVETGPALIFRDSPTVRRGETVITYGFPLSGLLSSGPTLTTGDVSALAGLRDNPTNFQISAPVQPGNSGGPLLDIQGNVIGVVVSKLNAARIAEITGGDIPQNVNFAVKGSEALAFLRENSVELRTAASTGPEKRAFEVGEIANPSTLYLQCYR